MPDLSAFYQETSSYDFYIGLAYGSGVFILGVLSLWIVTSWHSLKKQCASLKRQE